MCSDVALHQDGLGSYLGVLNVPLVLQEFDALQTSLLKHNSILKHRDSLPLNAVRGSGGSEAPSMVQEDSRPDSGSGDEVPRS